MILSLNKYWKWQQLGDVSVDSFISWDTLQQHPGMFQLKTLLISSVTFAEQHIFLLGTSKCFWSSVTERLVTWRGYPPWMAKTSKSRPWPLKTFISDWFGYMFYVLLSLLHCIPSSFLELCDIFRDTWGSLLATFYCVFLLLSGIKIGILQYRVPTVIVESHGIWNLDSNPGKVMEFRKMCSGRGKVMEFQILSH